jgi:hypothetical protein
MTASRFPVLSPEAASHIRFFTVESVGPDPEIRVERSFPAPHHNMGLSTETAKVLVPELVKQLGVLQECGISTPTIYDIKVQDEWYGLASIWTESEFVESRPLWSDGAIQPSDYDIAVGVAESLLDFHRWVAQNNPRYFMSDITKIQQYGVTPQNEAVLPDTDPYMRRSWGDMICTSVTKVSRWLGEIAPQAGPRAERTLGEIATFAETL